MKCSCCGQEITKNDRFCQNCGQNNEFYVEIVETTRSSITHNINQPINKVPININNKKQTTSTTNIKSNSNQHKYVANVHPINQNNNKITIDFSIASGSYCATFNENNSYEMSVLKDYNSNKKASLISGLILLFTTLLFIVPILMLFSGSELIEFSSLTYFVVIGVTGLIDLIVFSIVNNNLSNIKYDYILYDLRKKGTKITYENKSTGTISYSKNGSRNQISVYRGYNSHANSRYWK